MEVVPTQLDLFMNDVKQEEPKNIFVSVDTSVRLFVKKRKWARLTTVHVPAHPRCISD